MNRAKLDLFRQRQRLYLLGYISRRIMRLFEFFRCLQLRIVLEISSGQFTRKAHYPFSRNGHPPLKFCLHPLSITAVTLWAIPYFQHIGMHFFQAASVRRAQPLRRLVLDFRISHLNRSSFKAPHALHATALALIRSMTLLIPAHKVRSANTSTILPWSVKGGSWRTDRSFMTPLWTIYSTI